MLNNHNMAQCDWDVDSSDEKDSKRVVFSSRDDGKWAKGNRTNIMTFGGR